jgi:hypothetical protein
MTGNRAKYWSIEFRSAAALWRFDGLVDHSCAKEPVFSFVKNCTQAQTTCGIPLIRAL